MQNYEFHRSRSALVLALTLAVSSSLIGCKNNTPPAAAAAAAAPAAPAEVAHTREQAIAVLMALPELKAWTAYIEKASAGKTHGAVLEYGAEPQQIDGKTYFRLSYVENGQEQVLRWEDFLVEQDVGTIRVEDDETDRLMTLEQWRLAKRPMERVK
ncbi:hypothetical protein [Massilia sp. PWRC2]|uniref:hypothetical protein n=1 Tax=Massilia sp. PWRC2 TaxID=2804626 RepID=UPI003CFB0ADD